MCHTWTKSSRCWKIVHLVHATNPLAVGNGKSLGWIAHCLGPIFTSQNLATDRQKAFRTCESDIHTLGISLVWCFSFCDLLEETGAIMKIFVWFFINSDENETTTSEHSAIISIRRDIHHCFVMLWAPLVTLIGHELRDLSGGWLVS